MENSNAKLRSMLESLLQERTTLVLSEPSESTSQSQFVSHFGGIPYFEAGETWAVNPENNQPLDFIFQVVNEGNIVLPKEIGVLQFYYDWNEGAWNSNSKGWLVKTYQRIDKSKSIIIERPKELRKPTFSLIDFKNEKSLPHWETLSEDSPEVCELIEELDADSPSKLYQKVSEEILGGQENLSYLGGYPRWVQGEETPLRDGNPMKLLVEMDSEPNANLMWGDEGIVYIFYNENDITDIEFLLQCY